MIMAWGTAAGVQRQLAGTAYNSTYYTAGIIATMLTQQHGFLLSKLSNLTSAQEALLATNSTNFLGLIEDKLTAAEVAEGSFQATNRTSKNANTISDLKRQEAMDMIEQLLNGDSKLKDTSGTVIDLSKSGPASIAGTRDSSSEPSDVDSAPFEYTTLPGFRKIWEGG